MPNYNSPLEFNWLGIAFTSEKLPKEVAVEVNKAMDKLLESAQKQFDQWLDAHNLECVMGVIVEKGTVPQPKSQPNLTNDPTVIKIHIPNDELECESHDCAFNYNGICKHKLVKGINPVITETDGCVSGVIDIGL